jgi:hypothetical protein
MMVAVVAVMVAVSVAIVVMRYSELGEAIRSLHVNSLNEKIRLVDANWNMRRTALIGPTSTLN